jgi:hypothetical protein
MTEVMEARSVCFQKRYRAVITAYLEEQMLRSEMIINVSGDIL